VIVKPSMGLTQASTPADRGPPAGPASKHAAVHLGVWNAEGGVARAIADRLNTVRVRRTRTATRFNRLSVKGLAPTFQNLAFCRFPFLCGDASLVGWARKAYLWTKHTARCLCGRAKGCLIAIVKSQPQQSTDTSSRRPLTRLLLFPGLGRAHARGVEVALDPVELHGFSDRHDKKGAR
jgi:hypothetical protein